MSAEVIINSLTPRSGVGPWLAPAAIELHETRGAKIRAYGISTGDTITVRDVRLALEGFPTHTSLSNCITTCPGGLKIANSMAHQVCGVPVVLTGPANNFYLKGPGVFMLQFNGPSFIAGTATVTVEELPSSEVTDLLLRCCPCTT